MKNEIPKIPGFITYVVYMGEEISITLKPINGPGPMTLDKNGRWTDKVTRTYYKINSSGARWKYVVGKNKDFESFVPPEDKYIPANHLATQLDNANRRQERKQEKKSELKQKAKNEKRRVRRSQKRQESRINGTTKVVG